MRCSTQEPLPAAAASLGATDGEAPRSRKGIGLGWHWQPLWAASAGERGRNLEPGFTTCGRLNTGTRRMSRRATNGRHRSELRSGSRRIGDRSPGFYDVLDADQRGLSPLRGLRAYGIRVRGLRPRLDAVAAFAAKRVGRECLSYED